jgi:predicted Rossmann-fold nucleotide-binding protein
VVLTSYDSEARMVGEAVTPGCRLVVIGSTSFWGADSRVLCEAIAADLAGVAGLVTLTGGMDGVGLTFGRAFAAAQRVAGCPETLFHLLPRGTGPCDSGVTLEAGIDYHDRREVLGRVGDAYLVIEGGPGTEHEAAVAAGRGVPIIPSDAPGVMLASCIPVPAARRGFRRPTGTCWPTRMPPTTGWLPRSDDSCGAHWPRTRTARMTSHRETRSSPGRRFRSLSRTPVGLLL